MKAKVNSVCNARKLYYLNVCNRSYCFYSIVNQLRKQLLLLLSLNSDLFVSLLPTKQVNNTSKVNVLVALPNLLFRFPVDDLSNEKTLYLLPLRLEANVEPLATICYESQQLALLHTSHSHFRNPLNRTRSCVLEKRCSKHSAECPC